MSDSDLSAAIGTANQGFMDTFAAQDSAGVAQLYTDNGQLMPANSDFVTGKEPIGQFWQAVMDMGIKTVTLETVELEGTGDTAIEVGQYTLGGEGGETLDQGKYIVVWKDEGGWKLHRDIWNTSQPAG